MSLVSLVEILAVLLAATSCPLLAATLIPFNPVIVHPADLPFTLHTKVCWFPQSRVRFPLGISKPIGTHCIQLLGHVVLCICYEKIIGSDYNMYNTHSFLFPRKWMGSLCCTINYDSMLFPLLYT